MLLEKFIIAIILVKFRDVPVLNFGINGGTSYKDVVQILTYNCYNVASISGNRYVGAITGFPNVKWWYIRRDINCYTTNVTTQFL